MSKVKKKRPLQIRDGVILDPNVPHKPPTPKRQRAVKGAVRYAESYPSYGKLKTKEQLDELDKMRK